MDGFLSVCDLALHSNRTRQQIVSLRLWLKLILSLSYYRDGQENILRLRDVLDYFSDIFQTLREERQTVLIIIHNLCFSSQNRVRIAQHHKTLVCLKQALNINEDINHHRIAAGACWALMTSSQKAKGKL